MEDHGRSRQRGSRSAQGGAWRVPRLLTALRESFWFLPGLVALAASGLAIALVVWQGVVDEQVATVVPWLFQGEPASARTVMTAIAGSMATTTGTTFSVTVVALTLASRQFGPRVLRGFLKDRLDQLTIGAFIGTFLYALIVLRCIRDTEEGVPNAAVSVGFLFAVASMALLIGFIHHVAVSIQVSSVLDGILRDTLAEVPRAFPGPIGTGGPPELAPVPSGPSRAVLVELEQAFEPIRRHASAEPAVLTRILRALEALYEQAGDPRRRALLRAFALRVVQAGEPATVDADDREELRKAAVWANLVH